MRGYKNCQTHYDNLNRFISDELEDLPDHLKKKLIAECPGGGNVQKIDIGDEKRISLSGMSLTFGGNLYDEGIPRKMSIKDCHCAGLKSGSELIKKCYRDFAVEHDLQYGCFHQLEPRKCLSDIYGEVELDDMKLRIPTEEDKRMRIFEHFEYPCPCGQKFTITLE